MGAYLVAGQVVGLRSNRGFQLVLLVREEQTTKATVTTGTEDGVVWRVRGGGQSILLVSLQIEVTKGGFTYRETVSLLGSMGH